jgi:hypothetical protein
VPPGFGYGRATRPVSHLLMDAASGLMNLVYVGGVADRPLLDANAYHRMFESPGKFGARSIKSIAMGDEYTEIVAER